MEAVIALFTARAFLPGMLQRPLIMMLFMLLPCVDMITDIINSGIVTDSNIYVLTIMYFINGDLDY